MGADHDGVVGLATGVPVAVLRCNQIIRPDRQCSNGTKAKRQSPVRGSAVYRHISGFYSCCSLIMTLSLIPALNDKWFSRVNRV
jgi:hypothetical protein